MKRLLQFIIVNALSFAYAMHSYAWVADYPVGNFYFNSIDESTCKLTSVKKSVENQVVPSTIEYDGKTYTVTTIADGAFQRNNTLKRITLPSTVHTIGWNTFRYCYYLESINLDNVKFIDYYAFNHCKNLTDIGSLKSLETLGSNAFESTALTAVELPGTLKIIPTYAFADCENLTNVKLNNGIEKISSYSFGDPVTSLSIPPSVTQFDLSFTYQSCLESLIFEDDTSPLNLSSGLAGINVAGSKVKNFYLGRDIECSAGYMNMFYFMKNSEKLEIGPTVHYLRYGFFKGFSNIKEVVIGSSVESIPESAFEKCTSLEHVVFPASIQSIGDNAFMGCTALKAADIPASVKTVGKNSFSACSSLTTLTLRDGLQTIGAGAFGGCSIPDIKIPDSVTEIGGSAFSGCQQAKTIKIGNHVETIGSYAFYKCNSVTDLTIPSNVRQIGYLAFRNMTALENLNIEDSNENLQIITYVSFNGSYGDDALFKGSSLKDVYIGRNFTMSDNYYSIFKFVNTIERIVVGDKVTELPENALSVGWDSYRKSALTEVVLGKNVRKLGYNAIKFNTESGVTPCIKSYNPNPPEWQTDDNGYFSILYSVIVYVPEQSIDKYKNTNVWDGATILPLSDSGIEGVEIDFELPLEVFDINGQPKGNSLDGLTPGVYIIRQFNASKKILLK